MALITTTGNASSPERYFSLDCLKTSLTGRLRRQYARPRMEAFHAWPSAGEKTSAPGGVLHGAITYALKRWAALTTYLDDGRGPVDNNRCEQMMRPVAQGRKSWLRDVLEKLLNLPLYHTE